MFKFAASSLAIALALASFSACAADTSPKASDSLPTPKLTDCQSDKGTSALLENAQELTADHHVDIVESPTSCGGIPAPRMVPSDGYSTLCVNGSLRFINDREIYAYSLKVLKTVNGKQQEVANRMVTGPIGRPTVFQSGQETGYVKSVSFEKNAGTGASTATVQSDKIYSGMFAMLDPQVKLKDGSVVMGVDFDYAQLLSLQDFTTPEGYTIQTPDIRVTAQRSVLQLSPGKPVKLVGVNLSDNGDSVERLEVELTAKPLAN